MRSRFFLAACLLSAIRLVGQSIGFVQMEAPGLWGDRAGSAIRDAAVYVDNASGLGWGVLEANRLELQHRMDFVVITLDFGAFKPDPQAAALELARLLRGLATRRIFIQAGPCLRSPEVRVRYGRFVGLLRQLLPLHDVMDLSGQTYEVGDFTLIGVDSGYLESQDTERKSREFGRIAKSLGKSRDALLFTVLEKIPMDEKINLSTIYKDDRWRRSADDPKIAGVFVSVLGKTPQTGPIFPVPGKTQAKAKLHIVPRLDATTDAPGRGVLFVRAARDGKVSSDPLWMRPAWADEDADLRNLVIDAELRERNGDFDAAYKLYDGALKSKDPHVRATAEAGLRRTDEALQGTWEKWKAESVVARWLANHWRDFLVGLIAALAFAAGRAYFSRKRVQLSIPNKLSTTAPAELFWFHFLDSMTAIRAIWSAVPLGLPTPQGLSLDLAPSVGKTIAEDLADVKLAGLDVGAFVKWFLVLWGYFSWRIEISVYGTEAQTIAYARLCWAFYTRRIWMKPTSSTGPLDVQSAAWALACAVIMDAA